MTRSRRLPLETLGELEFFDLRDGLRTVGGVGGLVDAVASGAMVDEGEGETAGVAARVVAESIAREGGALSVAGVVRLPIEINATPPLARAIPHAAKIPRRVAGRGTPGGPFAGD